MIAKFAIEFDAVQQPLPDHVGTGCAWAAIEVDDFRERIIIPVEYWSPLDYHRQWLAACRCLLAGEARAAFLVDVRGDWSSMNMSFSWVAYVEGASVYVQHHILFPEQFPDAGLLSPHLAVHDRETRSTEPETLGDPISEWRTKLEAIAAFGSQLEALLRGGCKR